MILVLLADGFEEIEALTPVDMLRRAGLEVRTVGVTSRIAVGAHGISVVCDLTPDEVKLSEVSLAVFPGGMPGSLNLDASPFTDRVIEAVKANGGRLAAICAAPLVLGHRGILDGKRATCYPGFEKELHGAVCVEDAVVTDGSVTTSRGMGTALAFAEELVALVCGEEKARELSVGIMEPVPYEVKADRLKNELSAATEGCAEAEAKAPDLKLDRGSFPTDDEMLEEMRKCSEIILEVCRENGVKVDITDVKRGHRVTRYELAAKAKTHITKLLRLVDDMTILLCSESTSIVRLDELHAYIDVANSKGETVRLDDVISGYEFTNAPSRTTVPIGQDVERQTVFADIAKMPHLLVGGATGTGKTVAMQAIAVSLMSRCTPDELRFMMIDPKQVEFSQHASSPYLYAPIAGNCHAARELLTTAISLMEERYEKFAKAGVRNIEGYNSNGGESMPRLILMIDSLSDLLICDKDIDGLIMRIAQKSRPAGIHLVICDHPKGRWLSGSTLSNIPARLSTRCITPKESEAVLGVKGAERLLSGGDALYLSPFAQRPVRLQIPYISDGEVRDAVEEATKKYGQPGYPSR